MTLFWSKRRTRLGTYTYEDGHKSMNFNMQDYQRRYHAEHRDELNQKARIWYAANKNEVLAKARARYAEARVERCARNRRRRKERGAELLAYYRTRRAVDAGFRLAGRLRTRVRCALKRQGGVKSQRTLELIGCSVAHLRGWIEPQFKKGMSWSNMGRWHLDHIRPCASFDLTNSEQQRVCFNWKNLQPLWARDNQMKCASEENNV